jgi:anti-sigma-K factor RskA
VSDRSRDRATPLACDDVDDLAEEFALGLLDGAERAAVVAHIEGCRSCGARVAVLAEAGEQMLLVAPAVEPPAGFEQRVLDRLGPEHLRRRRRLVGPGTWPRSRSAARARPRWALPVLAVAATVAVLAGALALVVWAVGEQRTNGVATTTAPPARPAEHTATLLSAHGQRDVGAVVVVDSDPRVVELDMAEWMEKVADWDDPPPGPWLLSVQRVDGAEELHVLALVDDPRPRVALQAGGAAVASVSIRDGTGHVWCSAEL